jgi:CBS domain-containing protein
MTHTVGELIKQRSPVTVDKNASVREAARKMLENNVGAVVILDNGRLEGIFTERDALKFFVATRRNADVTDVSESMTKSPVTVEPGTELETARDIMVDGKFRHLPVVEAGSVVGVISLRELVNLPT